MRGTQHYCFKPAPMMNLLPRVRTFFLAAIILTCITLSAQEKVHGNLESADTVSLSVIRIYPDSFPNVSVIFRASSPSGQALWNLDESNVKVKENGIDCAVVSVKKLSQNEAVNTALVIDHSGSMEDNPKYHAWADSVNRLPKRWKKVSLREYTNGKTDSDSMIMVSVQPVCPPECQPPIMHAQIAAKAYLSSIDSSKDQTSLVGFSETVHERHPLSFNRNKQRSAIDQMKAEGSTAFYDAVYAAVDEVNSGSGIKAVVAMTDGEDNASIHSLSQVIRHARQLDIPVYVVGLGNVNKKVLRKLAKETGGEYYYTNDPAQLTSIYLSISKRIKSVYELVYASPNMASVDSTRDVELFFEIGDEYIKSRKLKVSLPESVLAELDAREHALEAAANRNNTVVYTPKGQSQDPQWPYAAGIAIAVAGAGILTARYFRNKAKGKAVELISVYPNPTAGPVTLLLNTDISAMPGSVLVMNAQGQTVLNIPFTSGSALDTDLGALDGGIYTITVQAGAQTTGAKQIVVTR